MNIRDASTPKAILRAGTHAQTSSSTSLTTKDYGSVSSSGTRKTSIFSTHIGFSHPNGHKLEKQHGYRQRIYV